MSIKIEDLVSRATVKETADITGNVSSAVEKSAIADEYLTLVNSDLKTMSVQMLNGISIQRGKELSDELKVGDEDRDRLLTALNSFVRSYILWNKAETIDAAVKVEKIIETHGSKMAWLSYEKESASLDAMLVNFEVPEAKAALATINQTLLIDELKAAQAKFKLAYQQSAEIESLKKEELISPSTIKPSAIDKLNALSGYLNEMSRAQPAIYGKLAATIAELINTLNGKIRTRYPGKPGGDEPSE